MPAISRWVFLRHLYDEHLRVVGVGIKVCAHQEIAYPIVAAAKNSYHQETAAAKETKNERTKASFEVLL